MGRAYLRASYAFTPNTVKLIPTLGALSPRGGPVLTTHTLPVGLARVALSLLRRGWQRHHHRLGAVPKLELDAHVPL